jgi:hypothetical protein
MRVLYLFCVYRSPEMVRHTIEMLNDGNNLFYIHVDANSKADFSSLSGIPNVHFASKRYPTPWSSAGDIYAILSIFEEAAKADWDYVCFLSEADYPVKSARYIADYLARSGKDHVWCTPLPNDKPINNNSVWAEGGRRRIECYAYRLSNKQIATIEPRNISWTNARQFGKVLKVAPSKLPGALKIWMCNPRRRHPQDLVPCGGDAWFFLRRKSAETVLTYVQSHPDYMSYCNDTVVLDELFFPTMVYNLIPHDEIARDILRYISWGAEGKNSPDDITAEDKEKMASCVAADNILLVRKVKDLDTCKMIDELVTSAR